MEIDQYAAQIAHEVCNAECFAFTGEGPKPHSARCQEAARVIADAMRKFGDPMQGKIERLRESLQETLRAFDLRSHGGRTGGEAAVYERAEALLRC